MAVSGYAPLTIHRIWRAFGLQPHRTETFKLSTDPVFVENDLPSEKWTPCYAAFAFTCSRVM